MIIMRSEMAKYTKYNMFHIINCRKNWAYKYSSNIKYTPEKICLLYYGLKIWCIIINSMLKGWSYGRYIVDFFRYAQPA